MYIPDLMSRSLLAARSNNALNSNPPVATNNITTHGSDWLWAVTALHALLLLGVVAWTYMTNPRRRVFHYFAIGILLVATIYYFVMASDLGGTAVPVEFRTDGIASRTRQIYYARWIGYFINFSLIFFALQLLSGVGWASILFTVGLVQVWALMFLLGALVRSTYKWGFFVFALLTYFFIIWQTLGVARRYAFRLDSITHRTFSMLVAYELFFMLLYPIAWGVSEGGNRIQNDSETVFYGILDIFTQGLFALGLLLLARKLDFDHLGLGYTEYGRIPGARENVHDEKREHAAATEGTNAAHGGTTNGAGPATTTNAPTV